ncbi:MAG: hypothetical protein CSB55_07220 [Candidatus Cloacimonadota bacterium]|nr:MAG: hypothetical protein CSB55_07220 [Candidatus Cloacimonadota bacterium]
MFDLHNLDRNLACYLFTWLISKSEGTKLCKKNRISFNKGELVSAIVDNFYSDRNFRKRVISFLDSRYLDENLSVSSISRNSSNTELWSYVRTNLKNTASKNILQNFWTDLFANYKEVEDKSAKTISSLEQKKVYWEKKYEGLQTTYKDLKKICKSLKTKSLEKLPEKNKTEEVKYECVEMTAIREKNIKLEKSLLNKQSIIDRQKEEIAVLKQELFNSRQTIACAEKNTIISEEAECAECEIDCENCPHNVLMVGGPERMKESYRRVINDLGGKFEYHAGHHKGEVNNLERLVNWADIVLCPVNINSHFACKTVKNLCKKKNTAYRMLSSCGISSVACELKKFSEEKTC